MADPDAISRSDTCVGAVFPEDMAIAAVVSRSCGVPTKPYPQERRLPVDEFEALKRLVAETVEDIRKAEGGNKAAGTRVRKQMQDIKNAAQAVRVKVLDIRDDN